MCLSELAPLPGITCFGPWAWKAEQLFWRAGQITRRNRVIGVVTAEE